MDIKNTFLIASIIIGFLEYPIGFYSIYKGEYKPHRTTRTIILIIMSIVTLSLFAQGDRVGLFLAAAQWIGCVVLFILSLKYGIGGVSKLDLAVLVFAVITIIIWRTTNNPTLALYMALLSDIIGMSPTLFKSYRQPFTEDPKFYITGATAGFFNLLALQSYDVKDLVFPAYIFLINLLIVVIILMNRKLKIDENKI